VYVYRMIMQDTIEEKVLKLQEKKKGLFQSVLEDEGKFAKQITEEDIRMMLE
jgi:SNF2 family DNA or RNA helicase